MTAAAKGLWSLLALIAIVLHLPGPPVAGGLGVSRVKFLRRRRIADLESRVEGLELLLAEAVEKGAIGITLSPRAPHSNGRGIGREAARRYSDALAKRGGLR